MKTDSTIPATALSETVETAFADVQQSFERLCLAAGIETLCAMMEADVEAVCGPRHGRVETRQAHCWGTIPPCNAFSAAISCAPAWTKLSHSHRPIARPRRSAR